MKALKTLNLTLWLLTCSVLVAFLLSIPLYAVFEQMTDLTQIAHLNFQQLMKNYLDMINYIFNPFINSLKFHDFPASQSGLAHFRDVKHLVQLSNVVFVITSVLGYFQMRPLFAKHTQWKLIRTTQWLMLVPVVLGVLLSMGFDQFFTIFHELLFRNSDWLFDPTFDPIINVLPESFFLGCFLIGFLNWESWCFLLFKIGKNSLKK